MYDQSKILILFYFISLFLLFHTYFFYPITLFFLQRFNKRNVREKDKISDFIPNVKMIIAVYNEEKIIKEKIKNCLSLDYPIKKLKFLFASDGSNDKTNSIIKAHLNQQIQLLELKRGGKTKTLNEALKFVSEEICVFSDANTMYESQTIKELVKNFFNKKVGCVCGKLVYRNPKKVLSGEGESSYWRYETQLKIMESRMGYVAGANGAIYAIRSSLFENIPEDIIINDDFFISMKIVLRGFKSIYEENALAYEEVAPSATSEFQRHVRDGAGHYNAVIYLWRLLNPFLGWKSYIYWSHRILRWLAPFLLIVVYLLNYYLIDFPIFFMLFFLQTTFYFSAGLGFLLSKKINIPILFYIPYYFCNLNIALILGFAKFLTKKQKAAWDSTER